MTKTTLDNATALASIKVDASRLTWFASYLKNWPFKWAGEKPSDAMLMVPVLLGKRPGVEAAHVAMCLRDGGCTVQQFQTAFSCGPANNYRSGLVKSGWFGCTVEGKPYAFKLNVTAKGMQRLERAMSEAAAAAAVTEPEQPRKATQKAKGKRISRKANVQPAAQTPTSEAPGVTEGHVADTAPVEPATVEPAAIEALAAHFNG